MLMMEEGEGFSLGEKATVTEANLRDEYYWKLVADFIGPQSGEGLELDMVPCKNRLLIQVGLLREDNNFPWIAILRWLKTIFPRYHSADFRRLIERGIATTLSLGSEARQTFLESEVNFSFVGPICDSIGVERGHLLEMRDFSERAQLIEVTNGLIFELSNFITREKLAPIVIVSWLRNFNPEFCKNGDIQKAYKVIKAKIKKLMLYYRNYETRRQRRNAAMENLLQTPFELVRKKIPKIHFKKRMRKDDMHNTEKVKIKEEYESFEIMQGEGSEDKGVIKKIIVKEHVSLGSENDENTNGSSDEEETADLRGEVLTLLDIAMLSVQKLSSLYGGKTATCKQVSLDLLRNQYTLMCKVHPAMAEFENKVGALREEMSLAPPVVFLNYNAIFLLDVHDAIEQHVVNFEKEITLSTGEKLGRDKLPKFKNFVNLQESATSRYIHMACDILSSRKADSQNYRKCWKAFCKEKRNPSRLEATESNRFIGYFEAAAGLTHHHKEVALFFSDLLSLNNDECPNIILESVAEDANDAVIQCLVCVLAIIYCKVLGPFWHLLKSEGEYSVFAKYMLFLYQRFLDWSKDPSTLLEPEESTNVFLQLPLQEKHFDGVFHYCGQWHTNRDMIRACLKRAIKVIAAVTDEHLKDFLPGGKFSQFSPPELNSQLVSCTFSVLMAPFGHANPCQKERPNYSSKHSSLKNLSSDSSEEDSEEAGLFEDSAEESSDWHAKQKRHSGPKHVSSVKREKAVIIQKEEIEENMDKDYIVATVNNNGGPCKTRLDLDKLMLSFERKSKVEKRERLRCEILYQKMILNNTSPHLNCIFRGTGDMRLKLMRALPTVKPGYSLVLAPKRTYKRPVLQVPAEPAAVAETEQQHMREEIVLECD
ncbi:hypothetical protein JOB18_024124 [Solea senegalensis]|uniref:Uncharacterized protein n=3 Tax=Solea senegalensis TaxID=28829 RepID=A0AAV6R606_SOLSE|nr:uncharacterized protein LOC122786201 isoform X1 [Solea senegalensis]KAG7500598.1 hypothetical protein JOB18_024124 [Solea senegalensis]